MKGSELKDQFIGEKTHHTEQHKRLIELSSIKPL